MPAKFYEEFKFAKYFTETGKFPEEWIEKKRWWQFWKK